MKKQEISNNKKYLVIENDPSVRGLIKILLEKNNYQVFAKKDGIEAMVLLEHGIIPDAILADTNLGRLNGFEFVKNIRNSGFFQEIPILIISNDIKNHELVKCLENGAEDYILKPFNPDELLEKLEQIQIDPVYKV